MIRTVVLSVIVISLAACAQLPDPYYYSEPEGGKHVIQGMIGVMDITQDPIDFGGGGDAPSSDLSMPMIGGATQIAMTGEKLQLGIEAGFTAGFEADRVYISVPGGVAVLSDNQVLLIDIFAGVYLNIPLGKKVRVYGGAGPLFQFGSVDLDFDDPNNGNIRTSVSETGVGTGVYARTGIEFQLSRGTYTGISARWMDSEVGINANGVGDYEFEGLQLFISMTTGF